MPYNSFHMHTGRRDDMTLIYRYGFFLGAFLFIVLTIGSQARAGDAQVYTNDDLEPYKRQYESEKKVTLQDERKEKHSKASGRFRHVDQQEYWCKRGTAAQEKVDRAKEKLVKAEEYSSEMRSKEFRKRRYGPKGATPEQKLEKAKEALQSAERAYRKIDDEAHRKGIPPGWLRCQF
jgi:hypothetical protein